MQPLMSVQKVLHSNMIRYCGATLKNPLFKWGASANSYHYHVPIMNLSSMGSGIVNNPCQLQTTTAAWKVDELRQKKFSRSAHGKIPPDGFTQDGAQVNLFFSMQLMQSDIKREPQFLVKQSWHC